MDALPIHAAIGLQPFRPVIHGWQKATRIGEEVEVEGDGGGRKKEGEARLYNYQRPSNFQCFPGWLGSFCPRLASLAEEQREPGG